ncbi:MAG: phosphoribosylformylglycinamidine synthase subunit PurL [Endomicrobium sp.]|jgi:phosphoribosylformylglycinamidine synthase|nr:phosphoribosylformylglycinamidine synthase subunit PurL [Endomicrobium sp.]
MKYTTKCETIKILNLSNEQLLELSKKNLLSLSLEEMKVVRNYFKKLKRNPTDIEMETIAQTWSEHCKHKTLTGLIEYTEEENGKKTRRIYNNLLKETIFKASIELNKTWCLSIFKDNAGIIEFDSKNGVAFKVETHNHPSALEPYGGSATGIGGVIRDILGVGLGAKPLANTDVFCLGDPNMEASKIPKGVHHPKRIMKGVVSGVRDYGNKMGIPTVNGTTYFDDGYIVNPLVYCGTMGIIPKNKINKKVEFGDLILVVGGRTGRDGIHGATFSSIQLDKKSAVSAVQIGNPIIEKKVLDAMLKARDLNLYRAVTDCGAGGLSSAVGELGKKIGAVVYLDKVPLKYDGLRPWEIWISEAQERMVFTVSPKNIEKIIEVFEKEDVEAVCIGKFTNDKKLTLTYDGNVVANMDMKFLHNGIPKPTKRAFYKVSEEKIQKPIEMDSSEISSSLASLLADLNICSKEWIIRQYDHEVQGQTVVKPLQGNNIEISGPGDAAVIFPYTVIKGTKKGIVLSNGLNPQYGKINSYKMAASAIEEALRNAVAVGADVRRISILDNFCFGNPNDPEILGSLVRATKACYDVSKAFEVPFISGKDSLHNEYFINGKRYSIPSVLLISAMGVIENVENTVTMPFKKNGNKIFVLGITRNELGGSVFSKISNMKGGAVPNVFPSESKDIMKKIYSAISENLIEACHDCSEGGIAVAVSEMAFSANKGVKIDIDAVNIYSHLECESEGGIRIMTPAEILFSESNGRFIVEIKPNNEEKFKKILGGAVFSEIGYVSDDKEVIFESKRSNVKIQQNSEFLLNSWHNTINL